MDTQTKEAQMYREEDKKEKERIDAKLHLEELCLRLQSSLTYERHNSKLSDFEKRTLMDACKQALDWIKENEVLFRMFLYVNRLKRLKNYSSTEPNRS